MGRGIGLRRCLLAALIGLLFARCRAPTPATRRLAERFRAAAALQARALYDLAADEYAAIERDFAADPLADRARLQRGICLFQLNDYAGAVRRARAARSAANRRSRPTKWSRLLAHLGLAEYNLSRTADWRRARQAARRGHRRARHISSHNSPTARSHRKLPSIMPKHSTPAAGSTRRSRPIDCCWRSIPSTRSGPTRSMRWPSRSRSGTTSATPSRPLPSSERSFPQHAAHADARARHGDALLSLAESQLAAGQTLAARRTVERLLAEFPESALVPPALAIMAHVQLGESELAAAEASLDECLARSTQPEVTNDARLLRAKVRYDRGNFAGSLADAGDVLEHDPRCIEALRLRGLCESGLGRPADAVKTFTQITVSDPDYSDIDRVLYDLAWAYQASNEPEEATATFAKLADSYPESRFAAECHFRVGEAKYAAKNFAAAAKSYFRACDSAPGPELLDKSLHKLAWSCFERRQFGAAEEAFQRQIAVMHERITKTGGTVAAAAPLEPLSADAMLMIVECRFQQQQYQRALESFDAAIEQRAASESLRAMVCVHAAQSAAETKNWERARDLADRALRDFPASPWADEARCERGIALVELGRLDDAQRDLDAVAAQHKDLLQVKAELALGKIHVARKDYDTAVRMFFKVAYGHGGTAAPASFHPWQAEAIFAAARVLEDTGRQDSARKLYQELVDNYPTSRANGAGPAIARTNPAALRKGFSVRCLRGGKKRKRSSRNASRDARTGRRRDSRCRSAWASTRCSCSCSLRMYIGVCRPAGADAAHCRPSFCAACCRDTELRHRSRSPTRTCRRQ